MQKLHAAKQAYLDQVLELIEGTYTRKSGVFQVVEKGLSKLSRQELSGLHAMLLTRMKKKSAVTFNVRRDPVFGEYEVEVFENGYKNTARSYFTDGREDAHETMKAMQEEENER